MEIKLFDYYNIDINDKQALQEQTNRVRSNWYDMIKASDELNRELNDINQKVVDRRNDIRFNNPGLRSYTALFEADDELDTLTASKIAIETTLKTISEYIEFLKADIRMLNSSMYQKF